MTHFFFSLNREPLQEQKLMPLVFYFDTHIITQVNLNVKYTFFDKVWNQTSLSHIIFQHLPRSPPSEAHSDCSVGCPWCPCWSCPTTWWSSSGGSPPGRRRHQRIVRGQNSRFDYFDLRFNECAVIYRIHYLSYMNVLCV